MRGRERGDILYINSKSTMRKPESAEIKHVSSVRKKINVELKLTRIDLQIMYILSNVKNEQQKNIWSTETRTVNWNISIYISSHELMKQLIIRKLITILHDVEIIE